MCLSSQAFGLFLSVIGLNQVSVETGKVTIHTPTQDVYWVAVGTEHWCTAGDESA